MRNRKTASITVFMSLMLMVVAALLFTLLEGSRFLMLDMTAAINSQSVTESMFAQYHVPAFHNYHLLLMDSSYGTGQLQLSRINAKMQELGQENLNPTILGLGRYQNFLQMDAADSSVARYELATDRAAAPLLNQISQLMKKEVVLDLAEQAYQKITNIQESGNKGEEADKYLDGALDLIEQAKETTNQGGSKEEKSLEVRGRMRIRSKSQETKIENPMDSIKSAKNSPLLAQILSGEDHISAKQILKDDMVERRTLNIGNYEGNESAGLSDKLLVMQYLKKYTSNYRNRNPLPHALAYEQEYILFGKASDEDNLNKMAARLLLIREGINFAYLLTDSAKCEEAFAAATAASVITGIPAAVKAIQMGILASWAYAESIAELRTLFSGGNIAAAKTSESWTVSLAEAAVVPFRNSISSKKVSGGLDYEDYLQAFIALESLDKIGMRFANLLEKNLRLYAGYEQVKLDCMITAMETEHTYQARQVFLTFVTIGRLSKKGYRYEQKYRFSYLEEN